MVIGYLAAVVFSMALYAAMGLISLAKGGTSREKPLHLAMAIALAAWSAAFILLQLAEGSAGLLQKINVGLALLFFSLLCHSSLLPSSGGWKAAGIAAVYAAGLLALVGIIFLREPVGGISRIRGFWTLSAPLASPLFIIQNLFCLVTGLLAAGLPLTRGLRMKDDGERKGALLRLAPLGFGLVLFFANQAALPLAGAMATPYGSPLVFSIWALGAIAFRFMAAPLPIGAANAAGETASPSFDYSLLVSAEGRILEANEGAQAMLGRSAEELIEKTLGSVVSRPDSALKEIQAMAAANAGQSSCQIAWITRSGKPCRGRSRISAVRNSFGRVSGYLIAPFALGESGALKAEYSLTDREIEVIHFAAQGMPNHEIARELSITERTVKAHLTNIYSKMGIEGKFRLMNRLKDFNV